MNQRSRLSWAAGLLAFLSALPCLANTNTEQKIAPKVMILSSFEVGEDTGDAPGEYQKWVEGEGLNHTLTVKGAPHVIRYNNQGVYGSVCSRPADGYVTSIVCSEMVMALLLDTRFDFSHTYWIINGIAGIDPKMGSIASAVWSSHIIDGDAMRELAPEDTPKDWPYGLYAIGTNKPNTLPTKEADAGGWGGATLTYTMDYELNHGLTEWAYQLSKKQVTLKDSPALKAYREQYTGFDAAQLPPQILKGGTLSSLRYWHGPGRTRWARDFVAMWSQNRAEFYTTAMEQAAFVGTMKRMSEQGLLDYNRILLIKGASNYCMPPPGTHLADTMGDESLGSEPAFEAIYQAGHAVIKQLLDNWKEYENRIPQQ